MTSAVKRRTQKRSNTLGPPIQAGYHAGNVTAPNKHKNHTCNKDSSDIAARQSSETFKHNNLTKVKDEKHYSSWVIHVLNHILGLWYKKRTISSTTANKTMITWESHPCRRVIIFILAVTIFQHPARAEPENILLRWNGKVFPTIPN